VPTFEAKFDQSTDTVNT